MKHLLSMLARPLVLTLCYLSLMGCGSWRISDLWNTTSPPQETASQPSQNATQKQQRPQQAALARPQLPAGLVTAAAPPASSHAIHGAPAANSGIPYRTIFVCKERPELADLLAKLSLLEKLATTPPDDIMGLEYRIHDDEETGKKILRAHGYYSGSVIRHMEMQSRPVVVTLTLQPGRQYLVGHTEITYATTPSMPLPRTLEDVGLKAASPAVAERILEVIDGIPASLQRQGYPLAQETDKEFAIIPDKGELLARVSIDSGPLARMGNVRMQGSDSVTLRYFQRMRNWRKGQIWNATTLDAYQDILTQQGLFRSVAITPVPADTPAVDDDGIYSNAQGEDEQGNQHPDACPYDVLVTVEDGPQKSVGGGLYYDSERGFGGQAFWEHRNLFGQAELLRAKAEIWGDSKEISLHFSKPGFLTRKTAPISDAWVREEKTDAYTQKAIYVDGGLQHRFGKYVWGAAKISLEGGSLEDNTHPTQRYSMLGLPLQLRFDTTNSLLNATRGVRATLSSGPYTGMYVKEFTIFPTELSLQSFLPIIGEDELVLALRAKAGTLWRDNPSAVPASIRYYAGGGGSVRGYDYQSLGSRDEHGNPRGGASFMEMSAELRYKITDTLGIVPFLDGGSVSRNMMPSVHPDDLQWSAGLGLRYYTSIGPIRADVAMPLNPRHEDSLGPAFYISIGQAF